MGAMSAAARALRDTALVAAGTGLLLGLAFPYRTDYAGHYLAGFGGTLLLLAVPLALSRAPLGWTGVALTLVAIGIGAMTESTIFRLAIFDPVDFSNQSLGAGLAAASLVGREGSGRLAIGAVALAFLLLLVGSWLAFA